MVALDKRWYLDVNRFARDTSWAHGFMKGYDDRILVPIGAGLLVLAALALAGWWRSRRWPEHMAAALWTGLGAFVAFGVAEALLQAFARARPYWVVHHVEVLVPRSSGFGFPNAHAAMAGAVLCGLLLARRWGLAVLALVAGLLLAFAAVYVGTDYPSDAAGGFALGAVVEILVWPLGAWLLTPAVSGIIDSRWAWLAVSRRPAPRSTRQPAKARRTTRLPSSRAMDALKAASEAARAATASSAAPAVTAHHSNIKTIDRPPTTPSNGGEP